MKTNPPEYKFNKEHKFKRTYPTMSGYTTSYNALTMNYPFVECISSMLNFCDEVVVVDHSTDGTHDILEKMAADEPRISLYKREWDPENPTMDGDAKAWARAVCQHEFCWQMDLDEIVHERDYEKIRWVTKRFPSHVNILHLPVIECWGGEQFATGRRHAWKWRLSRNLPNITHSVQKGARLTDPKTGQVYAKEGASDGCEYVDLITYEPLPHTGFYTQELEQMRITDAQTYEQVMNNVIAAIPSVYHYSWYNFESKISAFQTSWDQLWSVLYQKQLPPRFPKDLDLNETIVKLYDEGGEESDDVKYKWRLAHPHPTIMEDWISLNPNNIEERRQLLKDGKKEAV